MNKPNPHCFKMKPLINSLGASLLLKHLWLLMLTLCLGYQSVAVAQSKADEGKKTQSDNTYIVGIDDRVMISVWRNPELSLTVPVRPDGKISTPLVGDIIAAGKTPMRLASDIEKALSTYIREPHVSVIIVGLASHEYLSRVRITGAVRSPNTLPHRKGMTVLDLVLAAGGPNDFAAANRTILYRTDDDGHTQTIKIKLEDLLKKGKVEANLLLQPGDIITVPESLF